MMNRRLFLRLLPAIPLGFNVTLEMKTEPEPESIGIVTGTSSFEIELRYEEMRRLSDLRRTIGDAFYRRSSL